ncbi:unnamed protein product [Caenorhabditis angaria]|uniref:RING-type domain-containing protein n=1 Tax=Caenorhabditis angaria TaxID=860376 RepID=A0A9P1IK30_9PELO|nr:unnamed protein product [Caenorhabditis angaria]
MESIVFTEFEGFGEYKHAHMIQLADGSIISHNYMCLKLIYDSLFQCYPQHKSALSLIWKAEKKRIADLELQLKFFYMTEEELKCFRKKVLKLFEEEFQLEYEYNPESITALSQYIFPHDQYSPQFHKELQEIVEKLEDLREFSGICILARTITMSEVNIEDRKEWHLFTDEVLEVIEIQLKKDGKLEDMKMKLDEFEKKWNTSNGKGNFSIIPVNIFEKFLKTLGIDKSNFLLVPDFQFKLKTTINPVMMTYSAIEIDSFTSGKCYHQFQAQFLIFQFGAFDIFWNSKNEKKKKRQKKKIIEEMKNIKKGYTLAEIVEKHVENVKNSELAAKTPLSHFHSKGFDEKLAEEELLKYIQPRKNIRKFLKSENGIEIWKARAVVILDWVEKFFEDQNEQELKSNILKGCTFAFPFIELQKVADFENWAKSSDLFFNQQYINFPKMQLFIDYCKTTFHNLNEVKESHYLFENDDKIGDSIQENTRENKRENRGRLDIFDKISVLIPQILAGFPDGVFFPMEIFADKVQETIVNSFKEHEKEKMVLLMSEMNSYNKIFSEKKKRDVMENEEQNIKVIKKIVNEIKNVESCGKCEETCEAKDGISKKIEESEIENIERRKILEEKEGEIMKLKGENMQNKVKYREEVQKYKENLEKNEGKIESIQEEMKKYREDLKNERDFLYSDLEQKTKIADENVKKIEIELEFSKNAEISKQKIIENLEKENEELELELENASRKFAEICQKVDEHREEQLFLDSESESDFKEQEEGIQEILKFDNLIEKIHETCEEKSEVISFRRKFNIYSRILEDFDGNWENIPDFPAGFSGEFMQKYEEFLKKNMELEELFYEDFDFEFENEKVEENDYICLICSDLLIEEIEKCTKCKKCERKYHSECASKWLCLNSICPNCRNFLPDPCQYPLLNC